ncbi:unnamed protein product [Orchesella dallaii]|uniref:F-box domain-containing protein n=1 Tax=Orchesella dallaii TaxID=48710 RepID=A0ABP1RD31_9HEXA
MTDHVKLPAVDTISVNDVLPNEILEQVIHNLTTEADICATKSVCKRWKLIVDTMVGHKVLATNFYPMVHILKKEMPQKAKLPSNLKDITSLNENYHLAIRELTIGVDELLMDESMTATIKCLISTCVNDPNITPSFPFPHVLKRLSCFEPLPPDLFNTLTPLSTLSYLNISLFALSSMKSNSFSGLRRLRCLTTLIISNTSAYPDFNCCSVTNQLCNLLTELNAPNLIHLNVSYPVKDLLNVKDDCTTALMSFIKRHLTILTLVVGMCSPNQDIKGPTKEFRYPQSLLDLMGDLGKSISLRSVTVKDNHLHSLRPSLQVKGWTAFMKQQNRLNSLQFLLKSSVELNQDVSAILSKNRNTLKNLSLSCFPCELNEENDIFFVPVDCRLLSDCLVLQNLRATDRLLNTMYLPNTLKSIHVDAMLTNEDSTGIILAKTGVLETIEFRDTRGGTPKGFGYGITVESLKEFVKMHSSNEDKSQSDKNIGRKVKRLIILAGCTDGKFPPEGIYNQDSIQPVQLRKRKAPSTFTQELIGDLSVLEVNQILNYPRIDWELNEKGFYEDKLASSVTSIMEHHSYEWLQDAESVMSFRE